METDISRQDTPQEYTQIRAIGPDELFKLLPYYVRSLDRNNAMLSYLSALASSHNELKELMRRLPALVDPTQAGAFKPADYNEDQELYEELYQLTEDGISSAYSAELARQLPKSLSASERQRMILSLLAESVGDKSYSRHIVSSTRNMIRTAIYRHAIKSTHGSAYVIGRVLGFVELKVRELWSRYVLTEPDFPSSDSNERDFSSHSEQTPYWPLNDVYSPEEAAKVNQYPPADPDYNPYVLDDGGIKVVEFLSMRTGLQNDSNFYAAVMNGRNPFGVFESRVGAKFIVGSYSLSGGSESSRAYVLLPLLSGQPVKFTGITIGAHLNGTTIRVTSPYPGVYNFLFTGPQSRIKYKSSLFDLTSVLDPVAFVQLISPILVQPNTSGSYEDVHAIRPATTYPLLNVRVENGDRIVANTTSPILPVGTVVEVYGLANGVGKRLVAGFEGDEVTLVSGAFDSPIVDGIPGILDTPVMRVGRLAGELPLTGSLAGYRVQAVPEDGQYQLDMAKFFEVVATLRLMFEDLRPLSRTLRKQLAGLLFRDDVLYAPIYAVSDVVLAAESDNSKWRLGLTVEAGVLTLGWTPADAGEAATPITQYDRSVSRYVQWAIDADGQFSVATLPGGLPYVNTPVQVRSDQLSAYAFIRNGVLIASTAVPEEVIDSIFSDGYDDESLLLQDKERFVEGQAEAIADFVSLDAMADPLNPPSERFQFTRPQDAVVSRVQFYDGSASHLEDRYGWEDFFYTDPLLNFNQAGEQYEGRDVRLRATGGNAGVEDAPARYQDFNYWRFQGNHHNLHVYRDRSTNQVVAGKYNLNADTADEGGEFVTIFRGNAEGESGVPPVFPDGTTEGDPTLDQTGALVTPNYQAPLSEVYPWRPESTRKFDLSEATASDDSGSALLTFADGVPQRLAAGIRVIFNDEPGVVTAINWDDNEVETDVAYTAPTGTLWLLHDVFQNWPSVGLGKAYEIELTVPLTSVTASVRAITADGTVAEFSVQPGNTASTSFTSEHEVGSPVEVWITGEGEATVTLRRVFGAVPLFETEHDSTTVPDIYIHNLSLFYSGGNPVTSTALTGSYSGVLSNGLFVYAGSDSGWFWDVKYDPELKRITAITFGYDNKVSFSNVEPGGVGHDTSFYIPQLASPLRRFDDGFAVPNLNAFCGFAGSIVVSGAADMVLWGGGERDAIDVELVAP